MPKAVSTKTPLSLREEGTDGVRTLEKPNAAAERRDLKERHRGGTFSNGEQRTGERPLGSRFIGLKTSGTGGSKS
jgi:hypothetical protein